MIEPRLLVVAILWGSSQSAACATPIAPSASRAPSPSPPPAAASPASAASTAPDAACLDALRAAAVTFVEAPPTKGIHTPIRVRGPLGAIQLVARDRGAADVTAGALMDCELARALIDAAPIFADADIRTLVYSGTYAYRTRRGGSKLSEHAHGLAVDVHTLIAADGTTYSVRRDYERGVGTWAITDLQACVGAPTTDASRRLRTLACRLRATSILREVITGDDNSDHDDHFHLEAFPDAFTRARAVLSPRIPVADD